MTDLLLMFAWVPLLLLVGYLHRREGAAMRRLQREVEESVRLTLDSATAPTSRTK